MVYSKNEGKGVVFQRQFFQIISKIVQEWRTVQKQSLKDVLGTARSRNFKKTASCLKSGQYPGKNMFEWVLL